MEETVVKQVSIHTRAGTVHQSGQICACVIDPTATPLQFWLLNLKLCLHLKARACVPTHKCILTGELLQNNSPEYKIIMEEEI